MKANLRRLSAILLTLAMCTALFSACGSSSESTEDTTETEESAESAVEETEEAEEAEEAEEEVEEETTVEETAEEEVEAEEAAEETIEEVSEAAEDDGWTYAPLDYPLDAGDLELELWIIMDLSPDQSIEDWNDLPILENLYEWTGVDLYINAQPQANGTEKTNLMLAGGDYPDLIGGFSYTSGISAAIDDEIVVELTEDLLKENAPDYWQLLIENDNYNLKGVATDDGQIGVFASISTGTRGPSDGLMVRQNWLDDQGLEVPSTFDEATEVLLALMTAYDLKDPLYMTGDGILDSDQLSASFGVALKFDSITGEGGFFVDADGNVQFGYVQEGFVDYIYQMKEWYDLGIISSDFTSNPTEYKNEDLIEEIMAGETAIFSRGDGLMDMFISISGDDIQAIPDFTINEGDIIHLGNAEVVPDGTSGLVITTGCEEVELATQYINWYYTDEGFLASNYGIEGVSYEFDENGDPQYTEIMTSTEGRTLSSMKMDYVATISVRTDGLTPEASYSEVAQNAPLVWGSNKDGEYELPDGLTLTIEEGDIYSRYFTDISTYCQEMTCKFITGAVDLSEIETFQENLLTMGVNEICEVYQTALERYNAR